MKRLKKMATYGLLLACMIGFLFMGWHQNANTTQQPIQTVKLVKYHDPNIKSDRVSNYSPDKTYQTGDLVVKNGHIYEVQVPASAAHS